MSVTSPILAVLFHHRWSIPVLAQLQRARGGAKFITLLNRLDTSRPSLRRALDHLIEGGWVEPNPGYGHPMRPEYILTKAGAAVAPHCARLMRLLRRMDLEDTGLRKWPLSVALSVQRGAHRFTDIRDTIPGITARALALALRELQSAALIERTVYDETPPIVEYTLNRRARTIATIVADLARAATRAQAA
jgi:DNA-binding HxlR family transcriptional regulator